MFYCSDNLSMVKGRWAGAWFPSPFYYQQAKILSHMSTINLINPSIRQLTDKNGNPYFLIQDLETGQVFFCFSGAIPIQQWQNLLAKWETLRELELEFETNDKGNNRVINVNFDGDIFI